MKKFIFLSAILLLVGFGNLSYAQTGSGACSWHGGVNCNAGWQSTGTVYCNDGWTDSMVQHDFVIMCEKSVEDLILENYARNQQLIAPIFPDVLSNDIYDKCMQTRYQNARYVERMNACIQYQNDLIKNQITFPTCPENSTLRVRGLEEPKHCVCNEGYHNYNSQGFCEKGAPPFRIEDWNPNEHSLDEASMIQEGVPQPLSQIKPPLPVPLVTPQKESNITKISISTTSEVEAVKEVKPQKERRSFWSWLKGLFK